jgi:hypothetical protein
MSAEELALCSAIAEFRNSMFSSEVPWGASDMRGVNDKKLLQLIDVRPRPVATRRAPHSSCCIP